MTSAAIISILPKIKGELHAGIVIWLHTLPFILGFFGLEVICVSYVKLEDSKRFKAIFPSLAIGLIQVLCTCLLSAFILKVYFSPVKDLTKTFSRPLWQMMPHWFAFIFGLVLMDLNVYVRHKAMHKVPFLWRFHRVHHFGSTFSPLASQVHHPFANFFEFGIEILFAGIIGVPMGSALTWGAIQRWNTSFQHSQIEFPKKLERVLELIFILPRHHALHHSSETRLTNSNYCFIFNVWDRVFGTFQSEDIGPDFKYGLEEFKDPKWQTVRGMIMIPFSNIQTNESESQSKQDKRSAA